MPPPRVEQQPVRANKRRRLNDGSDDSMHRLIKSLALNVFTGMDVAATVPDAETERRVKDTMMSNIDTAVDVAFGIMRKLGLHFGDQWLFAALWLGMKWACQYRPNAQYMADMCTKVTGRDVTAKDIVRMEIVMLDDLNWELAQFTRP
jgi:hypothetical protein